LLPAEAQPNVPVQPQPAAAPAPASVEATADWEWLKLAFVLAALIFVGYAGWRILESRAPSQRTQIAAGIAQPVSSEPARSPAEESAPVQAAQAGTIAPAMASDTRSDTTSEIAPGRTVGAVAGFGRVLPFIDRSRGVRVAPEEGLLVVEYEAAGPPPRVRIGDRDLGTAPIATALPAGRHELVLKRDEQTSFRYVMIRAGETRIVQIRD
jgi:hypothetical protein